MATLHTRFRRDLSSEELFLLKIKYGTDTVSVPDICEVDYKYFEKLSNGTVRENIDLITKQMVGLLDFDSFDGDMWDRILRRIPEFSIYCDWDKLKGWDWECLLRVRPQFAEHCDWSTLNDSNWDFLLAAQPQLVKYRI